MRQVVLDITVNSNEEKVWDVLFNQFGSVSNFNPIIQKSFDLNEKAGEVGCERQCNFDVEGKKFVKERITDRWDNGFHIDIFQGGLPGMKELNADVYIDSVSEDKTKVTFKVNFQPKVGFMGAIMQPMIRKQFFPILIGMKYHIETGGYVDDKNIKKIQEKYDDGTLDENFAFEPNVQYA